MSDAELQRTQLVPRGLEETFAFFAEPRNLEAITPPWLHFRILEAPADARGSGHSFATGYASSGSRCAG